MNLTNPKVATICLCANADKAQNIENAFRLLDEAVKAGSDWIVLPEIFDYHGPYEKIYQIADEGELQQKLSSYARKQGVVIFAGSICVKPEGEENSRVYNRSYVFDRLGNVVCSYDKTHLFNLRDEQGRAIYCESDGFIAGNELKTCDIDGYRIGLATCYDLRFSGFFQKLSEKHELDAVVVPAAFTKKTGEAHWELMLRARAVEFQCYALAANQTGEHRPGKESFGHSMIIDPWGEVLSSTGEEIGFAQAKISKERLTQVRGLLPVRQNLRPELYK